MCITKFKMYLCDFQENEKSPSQNRKTKDASSDNIKGKYIFVKVILEILSLAYVHLGLKI